jgi:predicted ABC-type ATPase
VGTVAVATGSCRIQSWKLLLSELRELIDRQETFALESTLSGTTYVKIFEKAKRNGYAIELHFLWITDVREAIRRVR